MQSTYSYLGSPLHLILEDDLADAYNRAIDAFMTAQTKHKELHGTQWEPTEPLLMDWDEEKAHAHESIGRIINLLCEVNGGSLAIQEADITSDYLIKL